MNEELLRRLREEDLAFFGRIGADISHEMKNVLSIIGEYAGLLDDLLALAGDERPLNRPRLRKLSLDIANQVQKGTETMQRLSRFAHATDEQTASIDLTALVGNMVALSRRHVALAGCTLQAELPDGAIPVETSPFSLQHVVFSSIQVILDSVASGGLVVVKLVDQGSTAVITVSCSCEGARGCDLTDRAAQFSPLMRELKGDVETFSTDGMLSLVLSIPFSGRQAYA